MFPSAAALIGSRFEALRPLSCDLCIPQFQGSRHRSFFGRRQNCHEASNACALSSVVSVATKTSHKEQVLQRHKNDVSIIFVFFFATMRYTFVAVCTIHSKDIFTMNLEVPGICYMRSWDCLEVLLYASTKYCNNKTQRRWRTFLKSPREKASKGERRTSRDQIPLSQPIEPVKEGMRTRLKVGLKTIREVRLGCVTRSRLEKKIGNNPNASIPT